MADPTYNEATQFDNNDMQAIMISGQNKDGTPWGGLKTQASAAPLPTGGATAAKQDTGNASLSSIDGKLTTSNTNTGTTATNTGTTATNTGNIDSAAGAVDDPAVITDSNGTRNSFLRGLVKIFADVWDSVNHFLNVNQGVLTSDSDTMAIRNVQGYNTVFTGALTSDVVIRNIANKKFYGVFGRIDATQITGTYYLQVLNYAATPVNGAVNHLVAPQKYVHTNGTDTKFDIDLRGEDEFSGVTATVGIVVVLSTTEFTLTKDGNYLSLTGLSS